MAFKIDPSIDVFGDDICLWEKGQESGRTRPLDSDKLYKNLVEFLEVFEKHGIKCWISHGTMLGIYRQGDFIPYDDDADIGADMKDREKALAAEQELRDRGFFVPEQGDPTKPINKKDNMPYYDTVAIRDGEKIEVWWFDKEGDSYIYDKPRCGNDLKHPARYYDELQTMKFKDIDIPMPNYIEDWLVMMYGPTWKTPDANKKYNNQKG